jgi:hypothetical protein
MNTIPEEAGRVATSAIEGLKTNPSCLAAILLAALFALLTFFALQGEERRAHDRMMEISKLLHACYPASAAPVYPPRANRRESDDP